MKIPLPPHENDGVTSPASREFLETELHQTVIELKQAKEELAWKTAFLEAQADSSIDGIIVVDQEGKKILQNKRTSKLFDIPREISEDKDDNLQIRWVTGRMKNPEQFIEKVVYLYSHRNEISRDEIELIDGKILDRYSSPVVGKDKKYYGRIWTFRDITEQRRIQSDLKNAKIAAVLHESEQRYGFLADTVPLIIWTARPDGGLDYYNQAWFDYTGLTLVQTADWGWGSVLHPEDLQPCIQRWKHSISTGESYEIEYRYKRGTDGMYRWFLGRAKARRNEAGEIVQWVGTSTDIDDQKRAKAKLESKIAARTAELVKANDALRTENSQRKRAEQSLRLFESAVEQAKEAITITDAEINLPGPKIVFVNPSFTKLTGYSAEEVIGKTPRILQGPRTDKIVLNRLRKNLENGEVFQGETINYRKDGSEFYLEWQIAPIRNVSGKITNFVAIQSDITARKQAESSRERFVAILESTTDMVGYSDPDGHVLYLNRSARNRLGMDPHEDVTKTFITDFIPNPGTHPTITHGIPTALQQGSWSGDVILLNRQGQEFPVSQVILSHKSSEGQLEFLSTIMRDITERKRLEARLIESQKMETVGKLAGGVAHEFNSIMTAIIGLSELMLLELPAEGSLSENASEICKAAGRAATLTRQLLAYGRKQILKPKFLDLNSVLAGMESTLHHLVGRNTEVLIVPAAGLGVVKADIGQIEQVITNLVINASDAMPNSGKLSIETANFTLEEEYASHFPELKPGKYVTLTVTDTGTGMTEEAKAGAFEPFFSTKGVGQGSGLGLSTSYGIIKQSGGHISIYSELSRGSSFKIYLPLVEAQTEAPVQRMAPPGPGLPLGTETILLVDDNSSIREMSAILLQRLGYTVLSAPNGIEALRLIKESEVGNIDLLLTDVIMPQMGGKELAEQVREFSPNIRILFTSGYAEGAIVHHGVFSKGTTFLQKPFAPSALAHKLREALD